MSQWWFVTDSPRVTQKAPLPLSPPTLPLPGQLRRAAGGPERHAEHPGPRLLLRAPLLPRGPGQGSGSGSGRGQRQIGSKGDRWGIVHRCGCRSCSAPSAISLPEHGLVSGQPIGGEGSLGNVGPPGAPVVAAARDSASCPLHRPRSTSASPSSWCRRPRRASSRCTTSRLSWSMAATSPATPTARPSPPRCAPRTWRFFPPIFILQCLSSSGPFSCLIALTRAGRGVAARRHLQVMMRRKLNRLEPDGRPATAEYMVRAPPKTSRSEKIESRFFLISSRASGLFRPHFSLSLLQLASRAFRQFPCFLDILWLLCFSRRPLAVSSCVAWGRSPVC